MILIQSTDLDTSTTEVIKWLIKYKVEFLRINNNVNISNIQYIDDSYIVNLTNNKNISVKNISAYWYRRGEFKQFLHQDFNLNNQFMKDYKEHMFFEHEAVLRSFLSFLKKRVPCIGDSISCIYVNKNIILETAKSFNINIPKYIITTEKKHVIEFIKKHKHVITKNINNSFNSETKKNWLLTYTEKIDSNIIGELPDHFQTTLFQEEIIKKYEIRSFYLKGKFYSMAIFSQNDVQTQTDFRVYNDIKPNKRVPFKLPRDLEIKLDKFMKILEFESGSLDLIYSIDNQFYFLEVNPIGQFGMVSYPCNYYLEKKIAQYLINPT